MSMLEYSKSCVCVWEGYFLDKDAQIINVKKKSTRNWYIKILGISHEYMLEFKTTEANT